MPISKNFDLRKKILDGLIAKRLPAYSREELFDKLNNTLLDVDYQEISKRQFAYDIEQLKLEAFRLNGELKYNRSTRYYYYEPEDFSITGIPVSNKDIELLTQAIAILKQINGLKTTRELEIIIERLAEKIGVNVSDLDDVILFDNVPGLRGIEHLNGLLNAAIAKTPINISYKAFGKPKSEFTLHPYFLKEYNNRWYIFGLNEKYKEINNIPLDRILAFEEASIGFDNGKNQSPKSYFKDIIGVTRNDTPRETLYFEFKMPRGNYVLTKPLHHSQKEELSTNDKLVVSIKVIPNKELESLIASFGGDCKQIFSQDLN